ncbi:MAG: HAD hydrolase-like protein [Candidatus Binatia bacterium]|nr:HAD hydrolase-like protein [Candidatus Binatia bacterium]
MDSLPGYRRLERLRARGVSLAVVSDTGWDICSVFSMRGLDRFVDSWVLSFEHGTVKPDPSLSETACVELGVAPADALMVGDNTMTDGGAVAARRPGPDPPTSAARRSARLLVHRANPLQRLIRRLRRVFRRSRPIASQPAPWQQTGVGTSRGKKRAKTKGGRS